MLMITAIVMAVATPSFVSNNEEQRVTAATQEILHAIRFARSESVRKESVHAVRILMNTTVSVHELTDPTDTLANSNLAIHPHSKMPFSVRLDQQSVTQGVSFQSAEGIFRTGPASFSSDLYFSTRGQPFVFSPADAPVPLAEVDLVLNAGSFGRVIEMNGVSGLILASEV